MQINKSFSGLIRGISALSLVAICNTASAAIEESIEPNFRPLLNKITYDVTVEDWAKASSATVNVGIDAVANEGKVDQMRNDILKKLAQLTPGAQWHITNFARTQDQSGLERLQMQAQTRVLNSGLGDLRQSAKALSKPGATLSILNIDYAPSLAEIQASHLSLRKQIYTQVVAELAQLKQIYPKQNYYLHSIEFSSSAPAPEPQPVMRISAMAASTSAKESAMPVADKVAESAHITLASTLIS